jgi:hypothetical protein
MNSIGSATPAIPVFTTSAFVGTPDRMLSGNFSRVQLVRGVLVWPRAIYEMSTTCIPSSAAFRRNASSSRSVRLL